MQMTKVPHGREADDESVMHPANYLPGSCLPLLAAKLPLYFLITLASPLFFFGDHQTFLD